jgi:hypothetical protein
LLTIAGAGYEGDHAGDWKTVVSRLSKLLVLLRDTDDAELIPSTAGRHRWFVFLKLTALWNPPINREHGHKHSVNQTD